MLLRTVIPNKVTKPTIEPTDKLASVMTTATTPPIKAKGRFTSANIAFRRLPIAI